MLLMMEKRKGQVEPRMAFVFQFDKTIEWIWAPSNASNYLPVLWWFLGIPGTGQIYEQV